MKKITKLFLFVFALAVSLVMLGVSAFAEGEEITLKAVNTAEGIEIAWTEGEDVYYYELYRQCNDGSQEALISKGQEAKFVDTEAVEGLIYGYRVSVVTTDEEYGEESNLGIIYRIGATEISNYYSTDSGLYIEWTGLSEAKGYYVLRRAYQSEKWEVVAKCAADTTSYVDSKAGSDERYLYAVRAFAGNYLGAAANQVVLSYFPCPDIIGIVSVDEGIALKWKGVSSASYYLIYRSSSSGKGWAPYALLDSEYTLYVDKGIKDGESYSYIVRAADSSGQLSPYNSAVSMKHIKKPMIRSAESTTNGVKLTWTKSEGCQGYAIFRKDFGADNWALVGLSKNQDILEFVDSKVYNSRAYTYTVRAVWNKNMSSYDERGATVRFLEAPQTLLCDVDTASGNVLTWKNNPNANMFFIFRKDVTGKWKVIGKTVENSFADKSAVASERYIYTVVAYTSSTYISGPAVPVSTFREIYSSDTKMVALTYDDGPSDSITNGVLDLLETYGGKATFFVVGQNIGYGHEAMTRAAKMGCEIGTHTYSHIDLPSSSEAEIREEIELTDELVQKYTGQPTKIARAPGGAIDDVSGQIVGKPFFYWSVDTRDWESRDASSVIEIVQNNVSDGAIILMHDIYDSTLEASEYVIPWLISEGYQLVTISELMHYKGKVQLQPGVTYYDGFGSTSY